MFLIKPIRDIRGGGSDGGSGGDDGGDRWNGAKSCN